MTPGCHASAVARHKGQQTRRPTQRHKTNTKHTKRRCEGPWGCNTQGAAVTSTRTEEPTADGAAALVAAVAVVEVAVAVAADAADADADAEGAVAVVCSTAPISETSNNAMRAGRLRMACCNTTTPETLRETAFSLKKSFLSSRICLHFKIQYPVLVKMSSPHIPGFLLNPSLLGVFHLI